jgi:hypothetical protein
MANIIAQFASNPVVRGYAQSRAKQSISSVADFLAPTVEVAAIKGFYKTYTDQDRFHVPDTKRAYGGRAVEIGFGAADQTYNCKPNAIDVPFDNLEEKEAAELGENLMQEASDLAAEVGALSHEKTVITQALSALGAGDNLILADVDPVKFVDLRIRDVIKAAGYGGIMSVGVLFGATAWLSFKNSPKVYGRFQLGSATTIPNVTEAQASSLFLGNPEIRQTFIIENTSPAGVAESMQFLLDNDIIVFARHANPTRRDPSFMKTFRLAGQWMVPGAYDRDDGRVSVAKMDWSEDVKVTNVSAAKRIVVVDNT